MECGFLPHVLAQRSAVGDDYPHAPGVLVSTLRETSKFAPTKIRKGDQPNVLNVYSTSPAQGPR
jgi:hypothetical protein